MDDASAFFEGDSPIVERLNSFIRFDTVRLESGEWARVDWAEPGSLLLALKTVEPRFAGEWLDLLPPDLRDAEKPTLRPFEPPEGLIWVEQDDGSEVEYTGEEYIAEFGEEAYRSLMALAERMQSEADASAALYHAGIESLDDIPVEGDEENCSIRFEPEHKDDCVPFDLATLKYVRISQAAEIPDRLGGEIEAILAASGATLRG